jgi:hypothetical protein
MKRVLLGVVLAVLMLGGCRAHPVRHTEVAVEIRQGTWTRAEIVCGFNKPAVGAVTETEWQKFVDEEVTMRFPDGLTVIAGSGQWKGASGKVERENSRVIVIVFDGAKDRQAEGRVKEVAEAYGKRFGQEAVLVIRSKAEVEFVAGSAGK